MKKIYKFFALSLLTLGGYNANAQFGCGSAITLTNGYTATGIVTPGTAGAEDWNINPTGTSITNSYWDDDVYLFEYTSGSTAESISMTIDSRNGWNGIGIFDDCTGTTFSTELAASGSTTSGTRTVTTNIAAGNTVYIAVGQWGSPDDLDFDVTDFTVTVINCPAPTGLNVSSLSDTSATFGWTTGGSANANLEFGPSGFTPGTGVMVINAFNPLVIDTLSPNTGYEFYVQDSCGTGDVSQWTGPFSFQTPCGAYPVPWNEGFESITSAGDFPDCVLEDGDFITLTAPDSRNRSARTGSNYLNGTFGDDNWFFTVPVELTAGELYEFSTWMSNDGLSGFDVSLYVGTAQNDASVLDTLYSMDDVQSTDYIKLYGYYEAPAAGVYYFSIHMEGNFTPWYINFDDFKIDLAPTCPNPNSLVSTYSNADSVVLNWNAGYNETMWNIEYGTTGFTLGSGTQVTGITTTTDTIHGLNFGSVYEFYVQADCGGGDASEWVGPLLFATPVTNDSTCNAIGITPNTDYSSQIFSNIGATLQVNEASRLEGSRTHQNTVWFKTVVPASGHLLISTCGSDFTTRLGVYAADTIICDSLETFGEIAFSTSNFSLCGNFSNSAVEICGATPGDSLIFYVGGSSSTQSGLINLTVTDYGMEGYAGEGPATPVSACAGDTIDLWSNLTGQLLNTGEWDYPSNTSAIVDDTTVNTGAFSLIGNEVYYIVDNACDADSATVVINAATQTNTGIAVSNFQACSNGDVFLFDGLTGTVDAGGTWSTNSGAPFNGNKFIANGLPNGGYFFTYTVDNNICPPASTQIEVNLVDCTNITEGEATTFGVYPNPNDGTFFITNGKNDNNIAMEVIDVQGKVIYSSTYNMTAGSQQEVSLGNVESGVYLIRVITNNQVFNTNVIVK